MSLRVRYCHRLRDACLQGIQEREKYYMYIFECVQSDFTFVRTYLSAHTYMSAYMQEYVYYASPVIVLASLCLQHLQLLPTLLCDGRDVLGCCQPAV